MALFDIFRKKKKIAPAKISVGKPKKAEKPKEKKIKKKTPKVEIKKESAEAQAPKLRKKKKFTEAYRILKEPHISERATDLTAKNQYVFKVFPRSNKIEIKKAVENLYGVDVLDVKIIKVPAKRRRIGRIEGQRKGYKKAIVKIKEGQKIEVLPR